MEAGPSRIGSVRPPRLTLALLGGAAFLLFLLSPPAPSRADIYRWEDSQGTVHFTDDITNIPPQYRKNSTLLIREAPSVAPLPQAAPPAGIPQASPPPNAGPALSAQEQAEREKEDLASQVEQLKAKIAAKETHISAVDAKRSLAVNPLRNRFVDQADLDLYDKYQSELPADRERLKELESRLTSRK
ncbi:MAG TPA: DUF4124 domain-containing protein [Candidatus Deferrimicrobiaceae bacterium]|nr:DUF4124 domain-containing protein [Candidatus Deferrimicrobiaceae bacterium]